MGKDDLVKKLFDYLAENLISTIEMGFGINVNDFEREDLNVKYDEQKRRDLNVAYFGGVLAGAGLSVYCCVDALTELYDLLIHAHANNVSAQWGDIGKMYMDIFLGFPFGYSFGDKCIERLRNLNRK